MKNTEYELLEIKRIELRKEINFIKFQLEMANARYKIDGISGDYKWKVNATFAQRRKGEEEQIILRRINLLDKQDKQERHEKRDLRLFNIMRRMLGEDKFKEACDEVEITMQYPPNGSFLTRG